MTHKTKPDLRLTSVWLTEEQIEELDRIASADNPVSPNRASIIRRAIDHFLSRSDSNEPAQVAS